MSEIYGEVEWKIYVIIKPPWTVVTALKCAIKHWIAAINESFQRYAEHILKELLQVFEHFPGIQLIIYNIMKKYIIFHKASLILMLFLVGGRKLEDMEYILEKCSDLIQAVNTDKHYELMTQTFDTIMVMLSIFVFIFMWIHFTFMIELTNFEN